MTSKINTPAEAHAIRAVPVSRHERLMALVAGLATLIALAII